MKTLCSTKKKPDTKGLLILTGQEGDKHSLKEKKAIPKERRNFLNFQERRPEMREKAVAALRSQACLNPTPGPCNPRGRS